MPIYTYRCTNCGIQFDQQQKFSDATLTRCPECSKKALQKVFQPVGIVFKGSGFYATDNRSPSGSKHASKEEKNEKSSSESKSKSETSSESTSKAEDKSSSDSSSKKE